MSRLPTRCAGCNRITTEGTRCRSCRLAKQATKVHRLAGYPARRKALLERARANDERCYLCGGAIDYTLTWPHPGSFAADHVDPGNPASELRPTHSACNRAKADKPLTRAFSTRNATP